jgi:hypothetical protein
MMILHRHREGLGATAFLVLALGLVSCAPKVELMLETPSVPAASRSADCTIQWYSRSEVDRADFIDLGEVHVTDAGMTLPCNEEVMRAWVQREACQAGADSVVVLSIRKPDVITWCYRIRARLLRSREPEPASTQ